MFCKHCGRKLDEKAVVCTHCGCPTDTRSAEESGSGAVFALLGFFVPLAGLILYLIFQDSAPKRARSAGKGALIGAAVRIVVWLVFLGFYLATVGSLLHYSLSQIFS